MFRQALRDAIQFWESRRILYNLVLSAEVLGWLVLTWPHFRPALRLESLFPLLALAVLANLCYCVAYIVDIPIQYSPWRDLRRRWRLRIWVAGTVFAVLITFYWIADEIYPYVGMVDRFVHTINS